MKKQYVILLAIILLAFLAYTGLRSSGLHISGFSLVKGGSIELTGTDDETKIFLDNKEVAKKDLLDVAPGDHTIILSKDTYWPWKKDVSVSSNKTSALFPFLISKNVSGEIITQTDPDYGKLRTRILGEKLPSRDSPLLSKSSLVEIWSDKNNIYAQWNGPENNIPPYFCNDKGECSSLVNVLKSENEVRNIDFYKDRDDVLLIASQNGVFAIEIDKRGTTQNFQPVYKGTALPKFAVENADTIYVLDGPLLFLVSI